ncbi:MAG TPA: trypsin-like peptidase domain-containing protein [Longimicrobiaceae bacterium]|nr:trypsin-like peptidase domain-containing protein [Longimicrobiaceae bacterium]
MNRVLRKAAAPAAIVLGVGVAATAVSAVHDPVSHVSAQTSAHVIPAAPSAASAPPGPGDLSAAFRSASKAALPGVVYISVEMAPQAVSQQLPPQLQGFPFQQFFGMPGAPQQQRMPRRASGSGFIISPDGYILTNNHVVDNATRVTVQLTDKREFDAKVVGHDPNTDVAVIKIDGKNLPTVKLGDSDALQIGDWVLALGYPMDLGETVTAGIVSAKGKYIGINGENKSAQAPLEHFIQTDAAINPGNSGGPLINLRGEVVGINSAIASPTGAYSGYGFAVPIQLAKRVADDLIRYGAVHRPKLGIEIKDVQPADEEVFGLSDAQGAVVASLPDGPAKDAGVKLGDVIVGVNGQPIKDTSDLMERVALMQPGQKATLNIVRYGHHRDVTVKLGQFATGTAEHTTSTASSPDAMDRLGFGATQLTPDLAQRLGIQSATSGVVITSVDPMGPAAGALPRGMIVQRVNGKEIRSLEDLKAAASSLHPGSTVSIIGLTPDGSTTIINYKLHQ